MIDITRLDVRKKQGGFAKAMRGYATQEVDTFLELVAERLEELVKEVLTLRERTTQLQAQADAQVGRERAVQEALVTAQPLREEIQEQARQEVDLFKLEADAHAERVLADADRGVEERRAVLGDLERKRARFLRSLRLFLERELDLIVVDEGRTPLGEASVELELSGGQGKARRGSESEASGHSGYEADEGRRSPWSDSLESGPAESGASDGGNYVTSQPWLTPIGEDPLPSHEGEERGS
jgi:DivIVA domain-containing protein